LLQWAFSTAGLCHLIGIGVLAGAAILLGPSRAVGRFCLVALVLWIVASVLGALNSSTARGAWAGAVWALSVVAFYALFLGLLVAKGKGPRTVILTSTVLLLLQLPFSLLSGPYVACYIGHDCL
jgi:hypothetical protein